MNRYYSYLNSAKQIVDDYKGEEPLSVYLKKYFSTDKKFGSKDRKQIAHLCYCFFRLGKMAYNLPVEEKIITGLFLCSATSNEVLEKLKPEWNAIVALPITDKFLRIEKDYNLISVFPWPQQLTNGIDYEKFCQSFFIQPDLFLRIRPGYENVVREKLAGAGIIFSDISSTCIAISNTSKVDAVIELDKEAVVQDFNSKRTGELMKSVVDFGVITAWDCCAASGGKSILLYDLQPGIALTVSDIRESILINLKKRFAKAGISNYKSFIADLTKENKKTVSENYDLIIVDAPCSGSGTWSRTPEQLFFFAEAEIEKYNSLQQKIVSTIYNNLKPGAYLLYITCSVFKKENEDIVEYLKEKHKLELKEMSLLKGYDMKADTLFAALLYRPL